MLVGREPKQSDRLAASIIIFPTWENEHEINLRHKKKYIEFVAKTNRLYNSPLHYMRLLLNEEAAL